MRPVALLLAFFLLLLPGLFSPDPGRDDARCEMKACEKIPLEEIEPPDISQGPSVVTLDEEGFFVVNGVKFFPYGFYGHPSEAGEMEEFVEAGFNSAVAYGKCCQGESLQTQLDRLNFLKDHGVLGAVHAFQPVSQIYTEPTETLQAWIDARAEVGSLLYWYTYDEPAIWSIDPEEAEDYYTLLHDLDPNHPNALVMCPLEPFSNYMDYTDFMMVDPYPSPMFPLSLTKYTTLEAAAAGAGAGKRAFGVGQSFDWHESWGTVPEGHHWRPTVAEMRNITYQNLVFGVNGLVYFAYSYVHAQPDRWEGLKAVASEVRELMPVLLEPDAAVEIEESPDLPYVDHALREHDGIYYLLVVSTWFNDVTVSYDLSPLGEDLCVIDYFYEMPVPVYDGKVYLDIPKEGDAVLQIIP